MLSLHTASIARQVGTMISVSSKVEALLRASLASVSCSNRIKGRLAESMAMDRSQSQFQSSASQIPSTTQTSINDDMHLMTSASATLIVLHDTKLYHHSELKLGSGPGGYEVESWVPGIDGYMQPVTFFLSALGLHQPVSTPQPQPLISFSPSYNGE